jgi:hypothetical protein
MTTLSSVKEEPDYKAILKSRRIFPNDNIPVPPVCLEIGNQGNYAPVCTLGGISTLIGKAKQGKTFAQTCIVAQLINPENNDGMIRALLPKEKRVVVVFDTEQGDFYVQKVVQRICKMSGLENPLHLHVYSLRCFSPSERLELIEYHIHNTPDIGFVVIDGIRDLITSINDEEQASMITTKLLKWTDTLNIHIMTVLHTNKGDNNARGHVGAELVNKSETVMLVGKSTDNKDWSIVSPEFCKNKDFEPFAFFIDDFGIPQIVDNWKSVSGIDVESKQILPPYEVPLETHKIYVKEVFTIKDAMSWSELQDFSQAYLARTFGKKASTRAVKEWISHWIQFKYIIQTGKERTKASKYHISTELN